MTMPEPQPEPTTAHEYALAYAAVGLRVLPIRVGGKAPPFNSWQHAATNDPAKIDNWYKGLYMKCGVGIALGDQPNGWHLFALDCDNHGNGTDTGEDELHDLEQQYGPLPDTWRALTGSGGVHLVFRSPAGVTVRNQQATGNRVAPHIDVRGQGGQIVVAPTIHPETLNLYAWEYGYEPWTIEPAVAPAWLVEMVREPDPQPAPPPAPSPPRDDTLFDAHRADWNWHVELVALGWQQDNRDPERWTRPGKDPRQGHSAILHDGGPLVIFTTEIPHEWRAAGTLTADGSGLSFGPFGFYAATRHGGDRSKAAKALSDRYGTPLGDAVDLGELIAASATPAQVDELRNDVLERANIIDWHQFADTDHSAESWLWEPVIPERRSLAIYAKGGTGKSLVVLRMMIDIADAGKRVLYLDYEMTPDDLDDRLTEMDVDPRSLVGRVIYAQLPNLDPFDTKSGGEHIRMLASIVNADVVVIDTFSRAVAGEENESDTYRDYDRHTGKLLKQDGRTLIRIDHAGKDATKGQRGSSAKNDDVDLVWELKVAEGGYMMVRHKCRMGWVPENVGLERSDSPFRLTVKGGIKWLPGTPDVAKMLDDLNVDAEWGEKRVRPILKEAGHRVENKVLRQAIKYRRERSSTFHFASDLVATKRENTAPEIVRRSSGGAPSGAVSGAPVRDDANTQVDDLRRSVRRSAAHPSDADAAQCATPQVAQAPSVPPEDPPPTLEEVGL